MVICSMLERHYKIILYFISTAIIATLALQVYWNYKNYQTSKQQLINEVQISLDNAVNNYYTNLAEKNMIGFSISELGNTLTKDSIEILLHEYSSPKGVSAKDPNTFIFLNESGKSEHTAVFTETDHKNVDTLLTNINLDKNVRREIIQRHFNKDSLFENNLARLTTRIIFAAKEDTLNLKQLNELVSEELERKKIVADYRILFTSEKDRITTYGASNLGTPYLKTATKSSFLPENQKIELQFTNVMGTILRKNTLSLLFSFLFVVTIIGCLLYLLKVIKHQKQLAEIKNDLISNITHEFKTPIATIGVAMEGIQSFNDSQDTEKNMRYAKISSEQVSKLNMMVERLLETATLDSENLQLQFEAVDLVNLLKTKTTTETLTDKNKTIRFQSNCNTLFHQIDLFHFENALNNIIDNAIKYGSTPIDIKLEKKDAITIISIADAGNSLTIAQKKQIFEKFYRVPTGNTHNIKGFGIGLYYSKKIIEKHHGSIQVSVKPTTFTIKLPHD